MSDFLEEATQEFRRAATIGIWHGSASEFGRSRCRLRILTSREIPLSVLENASQNRLRPLVAKQTGTLVIHEIYRSLQGEGSLMGLPCTFVRLTACHLRCRYCDTPHAFHQGQTIGVEEVLQQALATGDDLVEVTGGEPLLQPEVHDLMRGLADRDRTVLLETSGAIDVREVDPRVRIILDIKTPGSGEVLANHWSNLECLKPIDEVKFVICDRKDFDWAVEVLERYQLVEKCEVLFSPAAGELEAETLADWILDSRLKVRLQIQLHKLLWGAQTRGV